MDNKLERKLNSLRQKIRKLDSAVIAFSGGLDSTVLTRICRDELGTRAVAVTSLSDDYPNPELAVAKRIAKIIGIKHVVLETHAGAGINGLSMVYSNLKSVAMRMKLKNAIDSSHIDDANERKLAAKRARIKSPLLETNLSKAEIRLLAKELGISTFDAPVKSRKKSKMCRKKQRKSTAKKRRKV